MIAELGHLLAFLAMASAGAQALLGLTVRDEASAGASVQRLAIATGGFALGSFLLLVISFVQLDFSLLVVSQHSHSMKPIIYRIAGTWGNHEGSILLWCVIMSGYGAVAAMAMRNDALRAKALGVQGLLTLASLAYVLFASSPFVRLDPAPMDGGGLNPLLQDPALAIHPPMLYLGYVGFSFVFSIAAAGLILGKIDQDWARRVRPWALTAWSALTVGISLGAIWAYYELGWGGWWFWDPVENASFMPWLVGAALVHSLLVTQKRGGMASWTVFLSVVAFCLSILGAFLTRSGILTSVHAFAVDPQRGMLLLIGLAAAAGGAFTLFAWRAPKLMSGPEFDPVSREGALILNNLFLAVSAATVLTGTLFTLITEAFGTKVSVQEPYFVRTVVPMMTVLFLFMPFAEMSTWRKTEVAPLARRLAVAGVVALAAGGLAMLVYGGSLWLGVGVFVGAWVFGGVITDLVRRIGPGGAKRAVKLNGSVWGMTIAHIGIAIFVIGAACENAAREERTFAMASGDQVEMNGRTFTFNGVRDVEGPNYFATRADIDVTRGGQTGVMQPEKRVYPVAGTPTTEVAIRKTLGGDVYVALGDSVRDQPGVWRVRISHHPLIDWVFGGALLIAVGGLFSLGSRIRERLKAGKRESVEETATGVTGVSGDPEGAPA